MCQFQESGKEILNQTSTLQKPQDPNLDTLVKTHALKCRHSNLIRCGWLVFYERCTAWSAQSWTHGAINAK
jgi:hypothetical protein